MSDIQTFPQDEVTNRRGQPTMAQVIDGARSPEEMMSLLAAAFPKATMGEVQQAIMAQIQKITEEVSKNQGDLAAMEHVKAVVARDVEGGDKTKLGESLERLAIQGDRDAAAILAEIDNPDQKEFWRLFDEAVEIDPFWSKTEGGGHQCKKGAVHDTPEKLVAAYRARDLATPRIAT